MLGHLHMSDNTSKMMIYKIMHVYPISMVLTLGIIIAEGDAMIINRSYTCTNISLFETRKYTFLERSGISFLST